MSPKIKAAFLVSYDYEYLFTSLPLVYDFVDQIVLAIDINRQTWSGEGFDIPNLFFDEIKAIDTAQKIAFLEESFYSPVLSEAENEIAERNRISEWMGEGCWKLQIDADEYFIDFEKVVRFLKDRDHLLENPNAHAVNVRANWVTLFKKTPNGYLYVDNREHFSFATNVVGRHYFARDLSAVDNSEIRTDFVAIHQSWAREPQEILKKINNWTHRNDFDVKKYFHFWQEVNEDNYVNFVDLHPFHPRHWKRLKFIRCESVAGFTEAYKRMANLEKNYALEIKDSQKKHMRILLDPQTYNEQKFGGISRYYTELYLGLNKIDGVTVTCPIVYSDNLHLKEAGLFQGFKNLVFESPLLPKFIKKKILKKTKRKNIRKAKKALRAQEFDVFVPTYYTPYFLDTLGDKPFVLTVYDMIHEIFPEYFTRDLFTSKNKKLLMEKATKIIAISESTKQDILKIYPHIDAAKIEVVYLSHSIKTTALVALDLPKNYILFVGNRSIYKNFIFFLKAVAPLLKSNPDLFVVAAGGNKFNTEELELIKELGVSKQLIQQNFQDNELATYYSNAKCFVFASEYEGFGIPVLESMACGCPVVLARHSSFPEVAGDAGVYFELHNAEDLKNKVAGLVENPVLRNEFSQKGLEQVQRFSWQKTADDCLKVYQKAIAY